MNFLNSQLRLQLDGSRPLCLTIKTLWCFRFLNGFILFHKLNKHSFVCSSLFAKRLSGDEISEKWVKERLEQDTHWLYVDRFQSQDWAVNSANRA